MSLALWISFTLATLLVDLTPGPSVMLAVSVTISRSLKHGLQTIAGLQTGSLIWFTVAVVAMLSSYDVSTKFLDIFGVAGALYLCYMGLRSFVSLPDIFAFLDFRKKFSVDVAGKDKSPPAYWAGLMTQLANPKSYIYWLAFLPQFQPAGGPNLGHNLLLMLIATIGTVGTLLLFVYFAHKMRHLFINKIWQQRLDWLSGGVLIALGLWMLGRHFGLA